MDSIYIVWLREYVLSKKNVYKIGNTGDIFQRMKNYPKGSILLHMSITPYRKIIETELIALFKIHFIWRKDLGREYFEGEFDKMRNLMHTFVDLHKFDFPRNLSIIENDHVYKSAAIKIQYYYRKLLKKKINAVNKIQYQFKKYLANKIFMENKSYEDTVIKFIDKEIINKPNELLYEKDVKNLFALRYPHLSRNNGSFRNIFQKYLGLLQIRNSKMVWLDKKFGYKIIQNNEKIFVNNKNFMCACGKYYDHKQSLTKHGKNCDIFIERKEKNLCLNIPFNERAKFIIHK